MTKNTPIVKRMFNNPAARSLLYMRQEPDAWDHYFQSVLGEECPPEKERCFYVNVFAAETMVVFLTTVFDRTSEPLDRSLPELQDVPVKPVVCLGASEGVNDHVSAYVEELLNCVMFSDVETRTSVKNRVLDYLWTGLSLHGRASVVI